MKENEVGSGILKAAFKVHSTLGPGLLESTYEACLIFELNRSGIKTQSQVAVPLIYDQIKLEYGYRIDLLVDNLVIVEIKAVESLNEIHTAQVLTYLKLTGRRLGYLLNFNVPHLKDGIRRLIVSKIT